MAQVRGVPRLLTVLPRCLAALGLLLSASVARAHISLEQGGTHKSRYGDGEIKDGPCGRENGTRGEHVYTYEPGQTITISAVEFIPHPGYFRIAFDSDGDDDFVDPRSIDPVDPKRPCPVNADDKCGESDFYNNDAVLMDNLNPHLAQGEKTWTWQVKLPDIECDNCTLQLVQVMEDNGAHGPYNPKATSKETFYIEDVYHQCIDIVLKRKASGDGGATSQGGGDGKGDDAGMDTGGNGSSGDGDGSSGDGEGHEPPGQGNGNSPGGTAGASDSKDSGCSLQPRMPTCQGAPSAALFLTLSALWLRRRRATLDRMARM
jgi:hypothetical protein